MSNSSSLLIRQLGIQDYEPTWRAMQAFTQHRDETTVDEIWLLQHPAVYTLGLNGKRQHVLVKNAIPIIDVDRGGQVTYHGPGQLVAYTLIDLNRKHLGVRDLVVRIEQAVIDLLAELRIPAERKVNAPGVYVHGEKIAALGLRIKKNRSSHGLSLNIDMDLSPFSAINPCGYTDLSVTQLHSLLNKAPDFTAISQQLVTHLCRQLQYNDVQHSGDLPVYFKG
jgi:lipoyl(octanoyl) transferase